jgi:pimeloyl-ACP methyl ester carboxylesterase
VTRAKADHAISPADQIASLDGRAARSETPCGDGALVWRRWGEGSPVVLLHGAYGSWRHWFRTIKPLAARHAVIIPDLPGLGDSAIPPLPMSLRSVATIIQDGLRTIVPATSAYDLVGFSFGGSLGGVLAMLEGRRVRSFTAISTSRLLPSGSPPPMRAWRHLRSIGERDVVHRANLESLMFADPAGIDGLAVTLQRQNTELARIRTAEVVREPSLVDALGQTSATLLAMYGGEDRLVSTDPESLERLARALPRLEVRFIPGASHWAPYEAADAVNRALLVTMGDSGHV